MKKYAKLFIVAIVTIFISIIPTYAKEVSLEKKENVSERDTFDFIIKRENPHANYVYLIGEYAFTSAYPMGLQDVMLAAKSIATETKDGEINSDPIFNKMTIYLFTPKRNGLDIIGWEYKKSIGETELPEKFNVKYIDYKYVKEDKKVNTDSKVDTAMKKLSNEMFTATEVKNNEVTVDIKTEKLKDKIYKGMNSGVFSALASLVQDTEVSSIKFEYEGVEPLTVDGNNLDIEKMAEWFNTNSETIFGKKAKDVILADLIDKTFNATINLGESKTEAYVSESHGTPTETYKINFTGTRQTVDTDPIVKAALKKLNSEIFKADETLTEGNIKVTIDKDKLKVNIKKGMGSGIIGLLQDLVNNEDVESVDFVYSNDSSVKYTLRKDFDIEDMITWFEENCQKIFGYPVDEALTVDLINKKFTAQINLKNYAQKKDENPTKYTISFDGALPEVDPETLLTKVMGKVKNDYFEKDDAKSKDQTIVIKVKDIDKSIESGMASGLYPALSEIAKTEGVQSIEFSYNGQINYSLTSESDFEEMAEWFNNNKEKIFGKKDKITLADLHEKEFTVKVNTGRVGKLAENSKDTYTIKMLKTHEVTFHDEKDEEKEVVTVYDGETIPTDEVEKRTKRDTSTEKFLGWYEEIEEGKDKEEKFDFDNTPITDDIELDAHWGKKLTSEEKEKLEKATEAALNTIKEHKDVIEVDVKGNNISVTIHKSKDKKVGYGLMGAGVKTAMLNFLDESNPVKSITLSYTKDSETYSVPVTKSDVNDPEQFVESFDELFIKITGKESTDITWEDLSGYIDKIKVKVDLKDDKVFEEGNGEYTFTLKIDPTESE